MLLQAEKIRLIAPLFLIAFLKGGLLIYPFSSLKVAFERKVKEGNEVDCSSGWIYFTGSRTIAQVLSPHHQWMVIEGKTLVIYYPERKLAFKIKSRTSVNLPFFSAFLSSLREDFGLKDNKFEKVNEYLKNGLKVAVWKPSKAISSYLSKVEISFRQGKMVRVEVFNGQGELVSLSEFSDYREIEGLPFPMRIKIKRPLKKKEEEIVFSHLELNPELPAEVVNFRIGEDVEVREVEW